MRTLVSTCRPNNGTASSSTSLLTDAIHQIRLHYFDVLADHGSLCSCIYQRFQYYEPKFNAWIVNEADPGLPQDIKKHLRLLMDKNFDNFFFTYKDIAEVIQRAHDDGRMVLGKPDNGEVKYVPPEQAVYDFLEAKGYTTKRMANNESVLVSPDGWYTRDSKKHGAM
jgi:hypothetical protein